MICSRVRIDEAMKSLCCWLIQKIGCAANADQRRIARKMSANSSEAHTFRRERVKQMIRRTSQQHLTKNTVSES